MHHFFLAPTAARFVFGDVFVVLAVAAVGFELFGVGASAGLGLDVNTQ